MKMHRNVCYYCGLPTGHDISCPTRPDGNEEKTKRNLFDSGYAVGYRGGVLPVDSDKTFVLGWNKGNVHRNLPSRV